MPICDILDRLACAWWSVFRNINLDILKGFSSEAELESFFLKQQYKGNISVIAGMALKL